MFDFLKYYLIDAFLFSITYSNLLSFASLWLCMFRCGIIDVSLIVIFFILLIVYISILRIIYSFIMPHRLFSVAFNSNYLCPLTSLLDHSGLIIEVLHIFLFLLIIYSFIMPHRLFHVAFNSNYLCPLTSLLCHSGLIIEVLHYLLSLKEFWLYPSNLSMEAF
jgi:hypothetical protein